MHYPTCQKVRGRGHIVTKTITVAQLLVTMAVLSAAIAGVGLRADTTAYFLV